MKLLDIANRYYLVVLILVFSIGSLAAYSVLKGIINHEFNEKLFAEKEQLIFELNNYENLQKTYYLNIGDVIDIREVETNPMVSSLLIDTTMYDQYEKKELPFRQLTFSEEIKGKYYVITISKSLLPNLDLIQGVSEIMIGIALLLMVSLGFLNRWIFKKLWKPFYQIIDQLQRFKISQPIPLDIEPSDVDEFNKLSAVLDEMITKNIKDYKTLREYTDNTSHEIQTPLAIIKNKAEILMQEDLTESQMMEVSKIYEASTRLARLKEGLSLLSKIENNQYIASEAINLKQYLEKRLESFEELIELKQITLTTTFHSEPTVHWHNDLAYMLITNLLSNAIKHNIQEGYILIILNQNSLLIRNSGKEPLISTDQLFERFKRSSNLRESTGLGLSIVKRITTQYNMKIDYQYSQDKKEHTIELNWDHSE
ncbi:MAG: HAMP domain-containing sensor histidine kinase [Marinoscillum sp.]